VASQATLARWERFGSSDGSRPRFGALQPASVRHVADAGRRHV